MRKDALKLRAVKESDCQDMYAWRNHPLVRKNSFNSAPISFDQHVRWFNKKRRSRATTIYIAYSADSKVGVIRFEAEPAGVKVNVMLNPAFLGRGLGTKLISLGVKKFWKSHKSEGHIIAEIKEDNIASIKAFEKAGFNKKHVTYVYNP